MNLIKLRNYQESIVGLIRNALKDGFKRILIQLPTGGGKTVIFSFIAQNSAKKDKRVLIITDREELMNQAGGMLKKLGLDCFFIQAGTKYIDYRKNVFVAMSQTLRNRIKNKEWLDFIINDVDLIIIDEAHIQEFNYLFEKEVLKDKMVLGFTATPSRSGTSRQLGLDYDKLIRGGDPRDLIRLGYLLNCDLYQCDTPDMKNVKISATTGDYDSRASFNVFDKPTLYKGLVLNYKKYAEGKKMIVFCCNVDHAVKTTLELFNSGYRVKFIASEKSEPKIPIKGDSSTDEEFGAKMSKYEDDVEKYLFWKEHYHQHSGSRHSVMKGFANNDFEILVNVDMLTKGYDESSIEVVAVYRATTSITLWLQMLGRGSRIHENKENFIVFDFGGNKERLGDYDSNREWSLWHESKKTDGGVPPLKTCGLDSKERRINPNIEGCERLILASYKICPFCGFKYPKAGDAVEVELNLASITDDNGVSLAVKKFSDMNWDDLETYRKIKKHKVAWLWRQLWVRGGEKELNDYASSRHWGSEVKARAVNYCKSIY